MKQLVNKCNESIRLVGLEDAWYGEEKAAGHEFPKSLYVHFKLPTTFGEAECIWSARDWEIWDYEPKGRKGESEEFRAWLKKRLNEKAYSAYGLSMSLGYSQSWFSNFLQGRSRLREKDIPRLAKELGVTEQTLRAKRARNATIRKDV